MENDNKQNHKKVILCSYCNTMKNREEFYRKSSKRLYAMTRYCLDCRDALNYKENVKKGRFIPKKKLINRGRPVHKILTRSVYKDEFEYILLAQKNLTNAHLIIRQMAEDRVKAWEEKTGVIWNHFLLELKMLNEVVEEYNNQKGTNTTAQLITD